MPRVFTVALPRWVGPEFPDRCVVCGTERPAASARIVSRDNLKGAAFWAGWHSVRVPCCRACGLKLQLWHVWSVSRTLLIAGGAFAFGMLYLLPRFPGWATGLMVLGLCILGFAAIFLWNQFYPPSFSVDPHDAQIDYEFRDSILGEEFARLNAPDDPI